MAFISFTVIAYNEERNIRRLLGSIAAQDGLDRHEYEVVVVNDHSADATAKIVQEVAQDLPQLRLIDLPENRGRGYARMTAIGAAKGELLATVDADMVLPPHWLATCLAELDGYDAVGGTAVPDGDVAFIYAHLRLEPRVVAHTMTLTGNNALYRRDVFDRTRFDPVLREGEDVAFNPALDSNGVHTRAIEGLLVRHEESKRYGEALAWLYLSGCGASRQLLRYRQIRLPDKAYAGFIACLLLGVALAPIRPLVLLVPVLYVVASAALHLHTRFIVTPRRIFACAAAALVNSTLLTSYYLGRTVGVLKGFDPAWRRAPLG
jgi:glycosyltransferase involved in cell wall biosynthesis